MTKLSQLKIDPEFQGQINPPPADEEQQVEQNILEERRLLNPIITWNGYIVDGHTRYRILKKHQFIQFEVIEKDFANRFEVLAYTAWQSCGRIRLAYIISARERSAFADATAITSFPPTWSSRAASTV